jgi:hypothetical protein
VYDPVHKSNEHFSKEKQPVNHINKQKKCNSFLGLLVAVVLIVGSLSQAAIEIDSDLAPKPAAPVAASSNGRVTTTLHCENSDVLPANSLISISADLAENSGLEFLEVVIGIDRLVSEDIMNPYLAPLALGTARSPTPFYVPEGYTAFDINSENFGRLENGIPQSVHLFLEAAYPHFVGTSAVFSGRLEIVDSVGTRSGDNLICELK